MFSGGDLYSILKIQNASSHSYRSEATHTQVVMALHSSAYVKMGMQTETMGSNLNNH